MRMDTYSLARAGLSEDEILAIANNKDEKEQMRIPCLGDRCATGSSYRTISEASHAGQTLDGLAIEASDVPVSKDTVSQWLW